MQCPHCGRKIEQVLSPQPPLQEAPALIRPGNMNWMDAHIIVGQLCKLEAEMTSLVCKSTSIPNGMMPLWIPEGLTANLLRDAHAGIADQDGKALEIETYGVTDLDATYQPYPRDRRSPQTLLLKDGQEAEHVWKNRSADWVLANNKDHLGRMLHQRLLVGLVYYLVKGQHLDQKYWTDCLGSRSADGGVPFVLFRDGKVRVICSHAGDGYFGVRSRSDGVS